MVRLISFIIIFAVFLVFIILNMGNKCDISFGFRTFHDVPIFLSIFISFVMGMLVSIPMIFTLRRRRKKPAEADSSDSPHPKEKKKRGFTKKNKIPQDEQNSPRWRGSDATLEEIKKDESSYGID